MIAGACHIDKERAPGLTHFWMKHRGLGISGVCLLALLGCASRPAPVPMTPDVAGTVDFAGIQRCTEFYRIMRYQGDAEIQSMVGTQFDDFVLVDLPAIKNRYMIGTDNAARRQEIWIRGTANWKNVLYDVKYQKHRNTKLGINLHVGFEEMALGVYGDILPRLHRGYDLVIFGHSLGAAEAVILAMLLSVDEYRVTQVYASGQPRVTDGEGENKFDFLPILRIINEGDPVPFLPPRNIGIPGDPYMHLGQAVVLLDGAYYCLLAEDTSEEALVSDFWKTLALDGTLALVKEHLTPAYLQRIAPKLTSAVQVRYADRFAHVGAP